MKAKEFIIENDDEDDAFYPMPLKLGDYRDSYNPRDHEPYDDQFKDNQSLRDMVEDLIDAGVEPAVVMISPRQLIATQDWLADARYRDSDPLFGDYEDRPVVLKYRGVDYILDGHHRCSAALRANQKLNVYMFTAPQGLAEAEPAHQHSDIFRTTHGKWIVYTGDHSMIRALTRGVGPRMITALLASLENIHNLDRVAIGQGFWITDVKTKSSVFFKRLDIPSEPYALRQETVVKDQPLAGKSTPVFKVNVYPGPEHPRDIKAMQHAKLVSRFVGVDTMAANLAKDMKRKRWNEPEVITDPEKQDSRRYDRAFDQAKKLPKDVAEAINPDFYSTTPWTKSKEVNGITLTATHSDKPKKRFQPEENLVITASIDGQEIGRVYMHTYSHGPVPDNLPNMDLSGEQLAVRVVPVQVDEFTCSRCFLIHHITQLAKGEGAKAVCKECS